VDAEHLELLPQQRGGLLREGWPGLVQIGGLALADAQVLNVVVPVAPVPRFSAARVRLVSPAAAGAPRLIDPRVGLAATAAPSATVNPRHGRNCPPSRARRTAGVQHGVHPVYIELVSSHGNFPKNVM